VRPRLPRGPSRKRNLHAELDAPVCRQSKAAPRNQLQVNSLLGAQEAVAFHAPGDLDPALASAGRQGRERQIAIKVLPDLLPARTGFVLSSSSSRVSRSTIQVGWTRGSCVPASRGWISASSILRAWRAASSAPSSSRTVTESPPLEEPDEVPGLPLQPHHLRFDLIGSLITGP
jgi:hypothetical protein